jgi:mRNA interferase RelE/StbE
MLPVVYTPIAEKYFKKLKDKQLKNSFKEAIVSIRTNPQIGDAKSGDLKGIYSLDIYYNRTNYELAYRISQLENGEMVVIHHILTKGTIDHRVMTALDNKDTGQSALIEAVRARLKANQKEGEET